MHPLSFRCRDVHAARWPSLCRRLMMYWSWLLRVQVLPYFHFYRGAEGRVAAFSASVSKIQRIRCASSPNSILARA